MYSSVAAASALEAIPTLAADGWGGAVTFTRFVRENLPELRIIGRPVPGFVYDPDRDSSAVVALEAAGVRADLGVLLQSVCSVTNVPSLSSAEYATVFGELAAVVNDSNPLTTSDTSRLVRDRAQLRGVPVGRAAISFIVQGLVMSGATPQRGTSADQLARAWSENVKGLCLNARMELSVADQAALDGWLMGGLSPAPGH